MLNPEKQAMRIANHWTLGCPSGRVAYARLLRVNTYYIWAARFDIWQSCPALTRIAIADKWLSFYSRASGKTGTLSCFRRNVERVMRVGNNQGPAGPSFD